MSRLLIMSDSNSGIKLNEAKKLGIKIIPMPFLINKKEYFEDINLSEEMFFKLLKNDAEISTSQPSMDTLYNAFKEGLASHDEILFIPMTSGLSGTCKTAMNIAKKFDGKVHVVDNLRISVPLKESILEAIHMRDLGYSIDEIENYLLKTKNQSIIYIYVDTLKYLKKGGRVTPATAMIANILGIRPVLYSKGGAFDTLSKCRSLKQAKERMIRQLKYELSHDFKEAYEKKIITISIAHTQNYEEALKFKEEILKEISDVPFRFIDPLSLSISCHTGPKCLGCGLIINSFLK